MAKRLKRRKSSILKNMNPDFVNKLSNIMGGAARAQDAKNKKTIGGRSNAGGKATPSKPKYPPLPPPLPVPVAKPTKRPAKINTEPATKPVKQEIKTIVEEVRVKSVPEIIKTPPVINGGTHIENNKNINENYFGTMRDIVSLSYENNRYFLENGIRYIVEHREKTHEQIQKNTQYVETTNETVVERVNKPEGMIAYSELKNMAVSFLVGIVLGYLL
tara:strand:- start:408 stop:1058 length:651 start_codon:yes stop_codon:yes gene_type:complete